MSLKFHVLFIKQMPVNFHQLWIRPYNRGHLLYTAVAFFSTLCLNCCCFFSLFRAFFFACYCYVVYKPCIRLCQLVKGTLHSQDIATFRLFLSVSFFTPTFMLSMFVLIIWDTFYVIDVLHELYFAVVLCIDGLKLNITILEIVIATPSHSGFQNTTGLPIMPKHNEPTYLVVSDQFINENRHG